MNNRKRRFSVSDIDEIKTMNESMSDDLYISFSDGHDKDMLANPDINSILQQRKIKKIEKCDINKEITNELRRYSFKSKEENEKNVFADLDSNTDNLNPLEYGKNTNYGIKNMKSDVNIKENSRKTTNDTQKKPLNHRFASYSASVTKKIVRAKQKPSHKNFYTCETNKLSDAIRYISKKLYEEPLEKNRDSLIENLEYLRDGIMICHINEKNREMMKTCYNVLTFYLKNENLNKNIVLEIFNIKYLNKIIEQIINLDINEAEIKITFVKQVIGCCHKYQNSVVLRCINTVLIFIHSSMLSSSIIGVLDILYCLSQKVQLSFNVNFTIFVNCILELTKKEVLESITVEQFIILVKAFYVDDEKVVIEANIYVHKTFEVSNTSTRLLLLHILQYILEHSMCVRIIIDTFINVTNVVLKSQNHRLIELICEIYNSKKNLNRLIEYTGQILPSIFDNLYTLTKNYWYLKGKLHVLIMLKKLMQADTALFTDCLKRYNLNKAMENIKNFDEEYTAQLLQLISIDENNIGVRRKSVLPDDESNLFTCNIKKKS